MVRPRPREAITDANILLRVLTRDTPELLEQARRLIQAAEDRRVALVLTPMTIGEVVYVLSSFYRCGRAAITTGLLQVIEAGTLTVVERDVVVQALEWYRDIPRVHFADAYIAAYAVRRSGGVVASFDRGLRAVPGITVVAEEADLLD